MFRTIVILCVIFTVYAVPVPDHRIVFSDDALDELTQSYRTQTRPSGYRSNTANHIQTRTWTPNFVTTASVPKTGEKRSVLKLIPITLTNRNAFKVPGCPVGYIYIINRCVKVPKETDNDDDYDK